MSIIGRLLVALQYRGKKQSDIAELLGIGTSTIGNWKTRNTDPPAKYILPICEYLEISTRWLLSGHGDMDNKSDEEGDSNKTDYLLPMESQLIGYFNQLPPFRQGGLLERAKTLVEIEAEINAQSSLSLGRPMHGTRKKLDHHPKPRSRDSAELGPGDDFNVSAG